MADLPAHSIIKSVTKFSVFQTSLAITNGIYKYEAAGITHMELFISQVYCLFLCAFLPRVSLSLPEPILKSIHLEAYFISY